MNLSVIILAAGAGTRMRSSKPKVLHEIAGLPMVEHVYNTSMSLGAKQVQVVYGHGGEQLQQRCQHFDVEWVLQDTQLGTAHAVQQASPHIDDDNVALILYGDVPLIKTETLSELIGKVSDNNVSLLTVKLEHPTGYGRIVRMNDRVVSIVEHKDASADELNITEINVGIYIFKSVPLFQNLDLVKNDNAQGEYYLTDCVKIMYGNGFRVSVVKADNPDEGLGVNSTQQLKELARKFGDKL